MHLRLHTCVQVFIKCSCWPGLLFGSPRLSDTFTAAPQPQAVVPMAKLESEEPSNLEQRSLTDGDLVSCHGKTCASLAVFSDSRTNFFFRSWKWANNASQLTEVTKTLGNIQCHTIGPYLEDLGWLGFKRLAVSCPSTILWKDSLKIWGGMELVAYTEDVCLGVYDK